MNHETSSSRKLPAYTYIRHPNLTGPYPLPSTISQEMFDEAISYEAKPEDVFLVTYPKCGTTWAANILRMLRDGVESEGILYGVFPFLEVWTKDKLEAIDAVPRFIKTHFCFDFTPWNPDAKYIVIARNPKDCFASFFYHTVGFINGYFYADGQWDDYFELAIKGEVDWGDYFEVVGEWYEKSKTESNILFLLYEDMKNDLESEILKMADFLGPAWGEKVRAKDGELLTRISRSCTFEEMKKVNFFPPLELFRRLEHLPFMRKGEIGDWKHLFSEEQRKRTDERLRETGKKYAGFDRLWERWQDI